MEDDHGDEANEDFKSSKDQSCEVQHHFDHQDVSLEVEEENGAKDREDGQENHEHSVANCLNSVTLLSRLDAPIA